MLKKLAEFSVRCDSESESTFTHKINTFQIKKIIDMWADVLLLCQRFHSCCISVSLDSYSMIDLVLISFVKFFDLTLCTKLKHQHVISMLEEMSKTKLQIYNFYHLNLSITDCFNHIFDFTCFFLAVDWNFRNSQILLD